jgi:predicted O-methyltransferase YrrM
MIKKLLLLLRYIKFWFCAKPVRSIHSPFVFEFCNEVLLEKERAEDIEFHKIHELSKKAYADSSEIDFQHIGAFSGSKSKVKMGKHARKISQSVKSGKILARTVKKFNPENIIELGTGAGIGTLYLAAPYSQTQVITLEGNKIMAGFAGRLFAESGFKNIQCIEGLFSDILPELLKKTKQIGIVFIDGDHTKESVLNYYKMFRPFLHENSIIILHDIYWSGDMQQCWKNLIHSEEVTLSIDTFFFGFVFFRKGIEKQNIRIKF